MADNSDKTGTNPATRVGTPLTGDVDPFVPLRERVEAAIAAYARDVTEVTEAMPLEPALHRSAHADYQADVALALGRRIKRQPREVAADLASHIVPDDVVEAVAVSGPGFINLTLRADYLARELGRMAQAPAPDGDERLGVALPAHPQRVVVDYSGPNVAKEMHVGHLRSTIIGDALARLLEFQGHVVIRQNHLGDWGTPFGMLIEHLLDERASGTDAGLRELVEFYKAARAKFDNDPAFADRARARVVKLQGGDAETLALWRRIVEVSLEHISTLYQRLGITLGAKDVAGESTYNPDLPAVVEELEEEGVARTSQGAVCVFLDGFTGREGEPVPLILRKQDGGYGYATTDLAAIRYRTSQLAAKRLIYVVGAPQAQHFAMVFATARRAGWADDTIRLEHVAFGSVLGPDKKMFKTRAGETVSLSSLVEEGIERARKVVEQKSPDVDAAAREKIAEAVGVGAIKYADLSNDRIKDYVFDWNRMLSFDGNTAPYLMYAHARIRSLLRKAEGDGAGGATNGDAAEFVLDAPQERALALELLQFPNTVARAGEALQPHRICLHLYEVAAAFTRFYESCPVLKSEGRTRTARLALSALTARVLARGLALLGIAAPEQM